MSFIKISDNIFLFKDSVNVYVIKDGSKAVLIDFSSGKILESLPEIGVDKVDYILHTHYHRDQCYGDALALKQNIRIAAPGKEKKLFSEAEDFWKIKSYYDLYSLEPTFFVSTYNIPVKRTFADKDEFEWGPYNFRIVETPGHTMGSVSYILETGNKKYAFTGDLIHSGGKVLNYYDLEYMYMSDGGDIGITMSQNSFKVLMDNKPDILMPSHGDIITEPEKEIDSLNDKFQKVKTVFRFDKIIRATPEQFQSFIKMLEMQDQRSLFPHIIRKGFGTTFIVLGSNQNCILIDFPGDESIVHYNYEELSKILEENNIKTIDFVIPTHYHDDHVAGIPLLQNKYNVKVFALENMVDILENPTHYRMGCLIDTPIKIDRVLKEGEVFKWDEYEFQVFHFPGQTEYHMGMFTKIDDKTVFFVGDSLAPPSFDPPDTLNCINLCQLGENKGFMKCADVLLKCNPEYIATSHMGFAKIKKDFFKKYKERVSQFESAIADVVAQDNPNIGFDPNWICFKPVRIITSPGSVCKTNLLVRNYLNKKSEIEIELNLPEGWQSDMKKLSVSIEPGAFHEIPVTFTIPDLQGRTVITANIIWNGKNLGPFPDLMIDHGYVPSDDWTAWHPDRNVNLFQWITNSYEKDVNFFR